MLFLYAQAFNYEKACVTVELLAMVGCTLDKCFSLHVNLKIKKFRDGGDAGRNFLFSQSDEPSAQASLVEVVSQIRRQHY